MSNVRFDISSIYEIAYAYIYSKLTRFGTTYNSEEEYIYEWNFSVPNNIAYTINFGPFNTNFEYRKNSDIYRNIFEHILFDLYYVQENLSSASLKQSNNVLQLNHGLDLYDLVYINNNGLYKKALANEKQYNVVGFVSEIINQNEFVLITSGICNASYIHTSDSGIIYLSDKNPGKFCFYEDIDNNFYTPVGFVSKDEKIIISILDSSVGDILRNYKDNIYDNSLTYVTQQDKTNIVNTILSDSNVRS